MASLGPRATRIARRHSGKPPAPNSWMAELVSHAVVAADETDGVIMPEEFADLTAAAQCMGLSAADVTQALEAAKTSAEQPRTTLLSEGDRVVFTGTLSRPREDWIAEIRHHGLTTGGSSKSTRVVVAADPDSLSGKARTARNYGVPVISEAGFRKHLAQYTAARSGIPLHSLPVNSSATNGT